MNFAAYFAPETSAWVVESLAHILWQGTLVAGLAALATLVLRNRSAQARYCVHCTAMLLTAACLPLNLFLLAPTDRGEKSSVMRSVSIDSAEEVLSPASNDTAPIVVNKSLVPIDETPIDRRIAAEAAPSLADTPEVTFAWEWASGWIVSAYIAGIVVMAIRLMMGLYGTQRLRKTARPVEEASLHSVLQRIGERLTLKVLPVVAYSARVTTPLVVGVIKPVILLPAAILSDLTTEQVESLLLHELAHIRRYDHWVNLIQRVIEAVLFFHPAVWWLSHKVSIEREHCCDDLAIHWGSKPCDYAESLVRISEVRYRTAGLSGSGATTLAATGGRSSQLRGRVLRVLGMPLPGPSVGLTRVGLVALLIVGGLLFVSPLLWHAQASPDSGGASRDESSIANEHIVPGIGFREYRIGKSKLKEILGEDSAENRRKWKERGYTFEFNQGRELTAISFHLPEFTTAEGIGPGSSIEEMREAYPEAKLTSVKNDKFKYAIWRTKGVEFWPDGKGRVAAVRVSANSAKESSQKGVATISGKIVFEDGSPATSKGWLYSDSSIKVGEHSTNSTASTEGQFTESFSCEVPAGTVSLAYFPEGYAPTWAGPFELKPGQNLDEITLTLKAGFSAKLILQNEDGKPVPDATVVAHPRHNDSIHGPVVEQLTDESGELLLKHLVKTSYEFTITAPGYQPLRTKPLRIEEGETFRPTMVRSKPAMGIIRFADGKPAPFSKIRVISEYREDGRTQGFGNDGEGFCTGRCLPRHDEGCPNINKN